MTDPALVIAWLLLAHLVADFVLQNQWIALTKGTGGWRGWSALLVHGVHVALCLLPVALAFGPRGIAYIAVVVVSHVLVDRWKVQATRRAEAAAQAQARKRIERTGDTPPSGLGGAWSPWPGILFLADQALHLSFVLVGWLVLLEGVPIATPFVDVANAVFHGWDRATVHAVILTGVVLVSLFIVNTRAAYFFVLALVAPREVAPVPAPAPQPTPVPAAGAVPTGYTVRMGPLVATVEPGVAGSATEAAGSAIAASAPAATAAPAAPPVTAPGGSVPVGAPARIGATIGALERLLIVVLLLTGAEAAVGFVIAAKTIARFKQLDERGFAEYYLLGTLASVSVAIVTALLAQAALRTLG
ncbi:MAG: DUF3307 domain-containing protein [Candidatus Limnocylindrales bacterium]